MQKLYIRGLVRLADHARRDVAARLTEEQNQRLRSDVVRAIATVEELLRKNQLTTRDLPGPTRKAYEYLRSLDLTAINSSTEASEAKYRNSSVRFKGLGAYFDRLLDTLARQLEPTKIDEAFASICRTADDLHQHASEHGIAHDDLTRESRDLLAWLSHFRERAHFDTYIRAVNAARPLLEAAAGASGRFKPPVLPQFRPMPGLYRVRGYADGTKVSLPTAMISFDGVGFASLAQMVFSRRSNKEAVVSRTLSETYRGIQTKLDQMGGGVQVAGGAFHDLGAGFDRVNAAYFAGEMLRPRLSWSRQITSCKFGRYDALRDALMISATLDSAEVPAFVVDFVVYHELLHKKHGIQWQSGRRTVHTPAFRAEERCFHKCAEADEWIGRLAKKYASGAG
jgi:hypothetical protein